MDPLRELSALIASGEAMLFTGAGFSADALDLDGRPLPDSEQMRCELWQIVFGEDCDPDASSLQDLYDVGLMQCRERLHAYLCRRLRIGDAPLPPHFAAWFRAGMFARIYTLNIDDLEVAVARQFGLPPIDVVHLNGKVGDDVGKLCFSTRQYAARVGDRDRHYEQLVIDLERAPFVFAGTTLDEVTLWHHLELRRRANGDAPRRPPAFLISSSLSRARQVLLESVGIHWVRATIADVAERIL